MISFCNWKGLGIDDLSGIANPRELARLSLGSIGAVNDFDIVGDLVFLAGSRALLVVDIADPTQPKELGRLALPWVWQRSLALAHGLADLSSLDPSSSGGSDVQVMDVSNPAAPWLISAYETSGSGSCGIAASSSHVFVASGQGLEVFPQPSVALHPVKDGVARFSLEGFAVVGATLRALPGAPDPDGNGPWTYAWQLSSDGANWSPVGGNDPTYTVLGSDEGRQLRVQVSYTDAQGFAETLILAAGQVPLRNDASASFSILGFPAVETTVTAQLLGDDPDGPGPVSCRWQTASDERNWWTVGDTSFTHTIASGDEGKLLRMTATYVDAQGFQESVLISAGGVPFVDDGDATFSLSGTAILVGILIASPLSEDPDGNGEFSLRGNLP